MAILLGSLSGGMQPTAPTIGTATGGDTTASVAFTASSYIGKGTITYTATSSPGGFTATGASSPLTVTGLSNGTAYTFTVVGTTNYGVASVASAASNSITPAAADSYESIATYVVSSPVSEINFNSIPATYKHLQIRALVKGGRTNGNDGWNMRFNSDATSGNYWYYYFRTISPITRNSGGGSSSAIELGEIMGTYSAANDKFTICVADIIDYANTTKFKTVRSIGGHDMDGSTAPNADTDLVQWYGCTWESTAAVNSIKLLCSNNLQQYSRVSLYGIKG